MHILDFNLRLNNFKCILIKKGNYGFFERVKLPMLGIEPGTDHNKVRCSTIWAINAYLKNCFIWTAYRHSDEVG